MNAAVEEWRVIAEFPAYAVSNCGGVRRIQPKSNGVMRRDPTIKLIETNHGYHQVNLWRDGKQSPAAFTASSARHSAVPRRPRSTLPRIGTAMG